MKEVFKTIISDFHQRGLPKFVRRDFAIPLDSGKIISLIGARRTGKTYLFYQVIQELLEQGVLLDRIVFVNFEDERLDVAQKDLTQIIEAYSELFPDAELKDIYFFFDEVQNVSGWEAFVRRLHDTISRNIFITGSSAKLLSKEIATSLRGRTVTFDVYPLSFPEYLVFLDIDATKRHSTTDRVKMRKLFVQYVFTGGFPEVVLFDERLRVKTLQNYADVMMYRDIVERYGVTNIGALEQFIKKNIANAATPQSSLKTYNQLRSNGVKISKDSLYEFAQYCEDAFFLFYVSICDASVAKQNRNPKKVYVIDTGLINATSFAFSENVGRLLENVVFIELMRQEKRVCYYQEVGECDFVVRSGQQVESVIQVTQNMDDPTTRQREIDGLLEAMKMYDKDYGIILTQEEVGEEIINGKKIAIMPIYEWLLQN